MAYLESIYGGLKMLREAAADRNKATGGDDDLVIEARDGFIFITGVLPEDLTITQKKKLDAGGWTCRPIPPEECRVDATFEWKRSC